MRPVPVSSHHAFSSTHSVAIIPPAHQQGLDAELITDPKKWVRMTPATGRLYTASITEQDVEARKMKGHFHQLPADISPLQLYALLRIKAGEPNGLMTFLREDSVDNVIQWDFLLEDDVFIIEVLGLNFRTEVRLWAFLPFDVPNWDEFDDALRHEIKRESVAIKKQIATFEKWHLFINPYKRLEVVSTELERKLNTFVTQDGFLREAKPSDNPEEYGRKVNRILTEASEMMVYSTILQAIAPVLGEAAVNLMIFLLAKNEVKQDARLLEDSFRRHIDVRIKKLPVDCNGFKSSIDWSAEEHKSFNRLMAKRNNTLHGNVDPSKVVGDPLYFDQRTIPLSEKSTSLLRLGYEHASAGASIQEALADLRIARCFVDFLLNQLTPNVRDQVKFVFGELHIGYRPSERRVGAILPRTFMDMLPLTSSRSNPGVWNGENI